jgi:hypothetical protein
MTWAALQSPVPTSPKDDSAAGLLADVLDARRRGAAWLQPEPLNEAAKLIVDHAHKSGATELFAASPGGFCAVGVALTLDAGLRLYEYGGSAEVLIVDIAVASRSGLETLAERLRETGARAVTTLVVDSERQRIVGSPRLSVIN